MNSDTEHGASVHDERLDAPLFEAPGPPDAGAAPQPPAPAAAPARRSLFGRFWPGALLIILLLALAVVAWQRVYIGDWLALRGYTPPSAIANLAADDKMTSYAKRLFYVNKPAIETKDSFNKHCSSGLDQVSVLGCFTGNRQGIYLYDVTDARLDGIQQVTAAHEMLHQAYDRLDAKTRQTVDAQLVAYSKTITDPDLLAKLDAYKKSEPNDVVNEMHSVFGTEVDKLPASLGTYYKRYFADRSKITKYHDDYQAAFSQRARQIASYDAQLATIKKQIEDGKASIQSQEKSLQTQRVQMNQLLAGNQTSQYNALVPGFNAQVDAYRQTVASTNSLIDKYNKLIDSRNQIAVQEQQLQSALDSHASAAPAQ